MAYRRVTAFVALALLPAMLSAQSNPRSKAEQDRIKQSAAHFSLDLPLSEDPPPPVRLNPPPSADPSPTTDDATAIPAVPENDGAPTAAPTESDATPVSDAPAATVDGDAVPADVPAADVPAAGVSGESAPDTSPPTDVLPTPIAPDAATGADVPGTSGASPAGTESTSADSAGDEAPAASPEPAAAPETTLGASTGPSPFSLDTPIIELIADPRAKAVLDKDMPGMSGDKNIDKFKYLSLRKFQPLTGGQLTDALLAATGADLAAIPGDTPAQQSKPTDVR